MPAYRARWIVLTFLYCAGIFYLSSRSDLGLRPPKWMDLRGADKLAHAVMYGGLGALVAFGLWRSNPGGLSARALVLGPAVFATLYGVTDEIHQLFVPGRSFDLLDLLADALGATIMAGVFAARAARRRAPA